MKRSSFVIPLGIGIFLFMTVSLWYKVFLPYSYFLGATLFAILLAFLMLNERKPEFLIFQLFLVYLLINNIYGIATHYSVLPYGDPYWEYAVVRTFSQEDSVSVIRQDVYPAIKLTWYSGWPFIHTLAVIFSRICGINHFQTLLILPMVLSTCSFVLFYLFLEKLRKVLDLKHELVTLGLLIYVASPDAIFWRTQFVRQNLGMFLLVFLFVVSYVMTSELRSQKRKMAAISLFLIPSLVISHHFTSFMAILYLFLLFVLLNIGKFIVRRDVQRKLFTSPQTLASVRSLLFLALLMMIMTFVYWDTITGVIIRPTVESRLERFFQVLTGARETSFFVPSAVYPEQLSHTWVLLLLRVRDAAIYLPSVFGLLLLWKKKAKAFPKLFVLCSTLAFGLLFIVNNLTFRVEPYRLLAISLPFVALLSALTFSEFKKFRRTWNVLIPAILIFIVLSSFLGLWGHSFAPMHLYSPSISPLDVGENTDPSSISAFVNSKIHNRSFNLIWTDDTGSLLLLLNPDQFDKIRAISPEFIEQLGSLGNESFCELSDLNVYQYFAGIYSRIETPADSKVFREILKEHLSASFNRVYDNEMYRFWKLPY